MLRSQDRAVTTAYKLKPHDIGEQESKAFLGEEAWKRYKLDYDEMLAYRKTIKGKPSVEQLATLLAHDTWLKFYGSILFHSTTLARNGKCACVACARKRAGKD